MHGYMCISFIKHICLLCCNDVNLQRQIQYQLTAISTKILYEHSNHCVTAIAIAIHFSCAFIAMYQ
jgi:hypothetical protein